MVECPREIHYQMIEHKGQKVCKLLRFRSVSFSSIAPTKKINNSPLILLYLFIFEKQIIELKSNKKNTKIVETGIKTATIKKVYPKIKHQQSSH